jgi:hypothetical protein
MSSKESSRKARVIAFYLPQFHPIDENSRWWGPGFTEWNSVNRAKPLFFNHRQPKEPADLGYYDLRVADTRKQQAGLAKSAGVEGFCYWHYWFGGDKRLLERPFNEVLDSGEPDFPFCLGWANHDWHQKLWDPKGFGDKLLIEQQYFGIDDYKRHFFEVLLPAFTDDRYIKVDNKPLFVIYSLANKMAIAEVINCWKSLAIQNGLEGIFFVAVRRNESIDEIKSLGFDAMYRLQDYLKSYVNQPLIKKLFLYIRLKLFKIPRLIPYSSLLKDLYTSDDYREDSIPLIIPNYDHTPRSGSRGFVLTGSTPKKFGVQVKKALTFLTSKSDDKKIIFLVSWNEWGEGNYMEPDTIYGMEYIDTLGSIIYDKSRDNEDN